MKHNYDKAQSTWNQRAAEHFEAAINGIDHEETAFMIKTIEKNKLLKGKIVDIGAGTGQFTNLLLQKSGQFTIDAFDISSPEVAELNKYKEKLINNGEHRLRITTIASFYDNKLESNQYDLAVSNFALNCARDLVVALRETARILKPDSKLIFSSTLADKDSTKPTIIPGLLELRTNSGIIKKHVEAYQYSPTQIIAALQSSGFEIIPINQQPITLFAPPYYQPNPQFIRKNNLKVNTFVVFAKRIERKR